MEVLSYWICELALLGSGMIYVHTIERRSENRKRLIIDTIIFLVFCTFVNRLSFFDSAGLELIVRLFGFLFLIHFLRVGRVLSWFATVYYAVWAFMSWQLLYELWIICDLFGRGYFQNHVVQGLLVELLIFVIGHTLMALTIGKWMPDGGKKKIGPRQFGLALLTFSIFQVIVFVPMNYKDYLKDSRWFTIYICQLLLAILLYLQNELFKKSDIKQELETMNLIWQKEKEQYKLSKENIDLINQKCHDLKHQIHAIRNSGNEDIEQYLSEMEESVSIYEAIVKTGNEALDTILTEKSLYCKDRGITVSCVADGSQMGFINTVDLYAILGNALDNAIEAVEKLTIKEMRQIDVLIYRQHQFLAINVMNPMQDKLVYEDELPVTTKGNKDYHGYGLKSINYIVKRYDGCMNISEENGCFSLMILIPVPAST